MSQQPWRAWDRPLLKLFGAEEPPAESAGQGGELSPRMTLSRFFYAWYLPVVLIGEQAAKQTTILIYQEAIRWWVALTGDPPVELIDVPMLAKFADDLRRATWRRGPLAPARPLSPSSVLKHLRTLKTIRSRLGPTIEDDRPCAELLPRVPQLRLVKHKGRARVKPSIPIDDCRRLYAVADKMDVPRLDHCTPGDFWRAWESLFFYGGLRMGEGLALSPEHLVDGDRGKWLNAPGELTKTGAPLLKFVHPHAAELLARVQTADRLLPWPHCRRWFTTQHEKLQELAGLTTRHSPHAWRRTHATQIALLGNDAIDAARRAMRHEQAETTMGHYVDLDAALIMLLPRLDVPPAKQLF